MATKKTTLPDKISKLSFREGLQQRQAQKDKTNSKPIAEDIFACQLADRTFLSKLFQSNSFLSKPKGPITRSSITCLKPKLKPVEGKKQSPATSREKKVHSKDKTKLSSMASQPHLKRKIKKDNGRCAGSSSTRFDSNSVNYPFNRKSESLLSHHYLAPRAIGQTLRKRFESKEYGFGQEDGHTSRDRAKNKRYGDSNSDASSSLSKLNLSNKGAWISLVDEPQSRDSASTRERRIKTRLSGKPEEEVCLV